MRIRFLIAVVLVAGLLVAGSATAEDKGKPNTPEREDYCFVQAQFCFEAAIEDCQDTHKEDLDGFGSCLSYEFKWCKRRWGKGSDCKTAPRDLQGRTQAPRSPGRALAGHAGRRGSCAGR